MEGRDEVRVEGRVEARVCCASYAATHRQELFLYVGPHQNQLIRVIFLCLAVQYLSIRVTVEVEARGYTTNDDTLTTAPVAGKKSVAWPCLS